MNLNRFCAFSSLFALPDYKIIGTAVLLALAAVAIGLLIVKKRAKPVNLLLTGGVCALLIAALLLTDFQSVSDRRQPLETAGEGQPYVELRVQCAALLAVARPDELPDGGVELFPETRLVYVEGESVDGLLTRAAKSAGLTVDRQAGYVQGINGIYEKAYGEMSGWVFTVNGEMPPVSAVDCVLSPGDRVEWRYSTDLLSEMG